MSGKVTNVWWGMGFFLPAHPVFPIQQSRLFSWQSKGSGWRVLWPAVSIAIVWTRNYNVLVYLIQEEKTGKKNSYDTSPKRAYSAISFFIYCFAWIFAKICVGRLTAQETSRRIIYGCAFVCVLTRAWGCMRDMEYSHGLVTRVW